MFLNDQLLQHFMTTFYGSGNYHGKYWFIGMEEGGGNDLDQVKSRIKTWQNLGESELVDLYDFHMGINYPHYHKHPVKLQTTWKQQIRIVLASKGKLTSLDNIRAYQRDVLGRKESEICLLELLPLTSPKTNTWHYDKWSSLPYLKSRDAYRNHCIPWRCDHIRSRIFSFHPKLVVFCGSSYFIHWQNIAGHKVQFRKQDGFWMGKSPPTLFLIVKHPAAFGITNNYFDSIGSFVRLSWE